MVCVSVQGEQGVIEILELLKKELQLSLALSGTTHTHTHTMKPWNKIQTMDGVNYACERAKR